MSEAVTVVLSGGPRGGTGLALPHLLDVLLFPVFDPSPDDRLLMRMMPGPPVPLVDDYRPIPDGDGHLRWAGHHVFSYHGRRPMMVLAG
jgi:hypothetical protein